MKIRTLSLLTCLFLINNSIKTFGQFEERFFFVYNDSIEVLNEKGDTLELPWSGGINSAQFSEIDLNFDGILDLFVFDRSTFKPSTFINLGKPGKTSYKYAPEYEHRFPKLQYWVILRDYNNDGRHDIFAHVNGGIKLYKNTSTKETGISFKLVTNRIYTNLPNKNDSSNITATSQEVPLIDDIDSDGDIDILVFDKFGLHVELNQNKCIENGNCNKLDLWKVERCWGNFSENLQDDGINLNAECIHNQSPKKKSRRHVGSTMLSLDIDGDKDKELLLADINSQYMGMLINGGTAQNANMTSFIPKFPPSSPIFIDVFPAAYYLDINNDKKKEILVTPFFDDISENKESVLLYETNIVNDTLKFSLSKNNFLQEEMIEVGANSYPVVYDYNSDSLPDLLVSNYNSYEAGGNSPSQIHYFQNIGTKNKPTFKLISDNWEDMLSKELGQSIFPTFGDLDGDGFKDLIVGTEDGLLYFYKNNPNGIPNKFTGTNIPITNKEGTDIDIGIRATPTLFDLNGDGLLDLVIGELNGNLNYYQNVGTKEKPTFELITQTLGDIDLSSENNPNSGITVPKFFHRNGGIELFLGSEWGSIYYYDGISGNLTGKFNLQSSSLQSINHGFAMSPELYDLNNDGFLDLITGNIKGGLHFFKGTKFTGIDNINSKNSIGVKLFPNPVANKIFIDFDTKPHQISTIRIYNTLGNILIQKEITENSATIELNNFKPGVYFLNVRNNTGNQSLKFIKN